jgi:hypothetical protein
MIEQNAKGAIGLQSFAAGTCFRIKSITDGHFPAQRIEFIYMVIIGCI